MSASSDVAVTPTISWVVRLAMALATAVAWSTTIFPVLGFPHGTHVTALVWASLVSGLAVAVLGGRWAKKSLPMVVTFVAGFAFPAVLALLFADREASLAAEPLEGLAGIAAWATLGFIVLRPEAILPTTTDPRSSVQLDLTPRRPYPLVSRISLVGLASVTLIVIGYRLLSITEDVERSILARTVLIAVASVTFLAVGEMGTTLYQSKERSSTRRRLFRARWALLVLFVLGVLRFAIH